MIQNTAHQRVINQQAYRENREQDVELPGNNVIEFNKQLRILSLRRTKLKSGMTASFKYIKRKHVEEERHCALPPPADRRDRKADSSLLTIVWNRQQSTGF